MSETKDVRIPRALYDFLLGAGPLEGCWFGDRPAYAKGAFWWRNELGKCAALEPAPKPVGGETVNELFSNCDAWGAAEWFDRLAKAIRAQDAAIVAGGGLRFETQRNIAASSAVRLVREFEQQVRVALAAPPAPAASPSGGEVTVTTRVWRLPDVETVLSEMCAVATGGDEEHDDICDHWPIDNRADVDRWQAAIRSALTSPEAPQASEVVQELAEALELAKAYLIEPDPRRSNCTIIRKINTALAAYKRSTTDGNA